MFGKLGELKKPLRKQALALIGRYEFEHCADDPVYWLDASKHPQGIPYVYTKDPHTLYCCKQCKADVTGDKRAYHLQISHGSEDTISLRTLNEGFTELSPIRPFTVFEYMPPIVDAWLKSQFLVIEKSRDMMATWLFVALFSWDVLFHKGRQHIFQSQDAGKTLELVQRVKIIYDNHPHFLKQHLGPVIFSKGPSKSGELFVLDQDSEILGFPQGPDQIRQFHPSGVFQDEAAFQIEAGASFAAIKPAIQMGGRFVALSSANRSTFESWCRDRVED